MLTFLSREIEASNSDHLLNAQNNFKKLNIQLFFMNFYVLSLKKLSSKKISKRIIFVVSILILIIRSKIEARIDCFTNDIIDIDKMPCMVA